MALVVAINRDRCQIVTENYAATLEIEPHAKLPAPHNRIGSQTEDATGSFTVHAAVGVCQTNVIEDIEGLSSELTFDPFRDPEILEERHVGIKPAWARQGITTSVTQSADGWTFPRTTGISVVG